MFQRLRMVGQKKRLEAMAPLQLIQDGADPARGVTHPKVYMEVRDEVTRADGSVMKLRGPCLEKPVACPSCFRPVTVTREYAGPGALPIRGGVYPFMRKGPVAWGGGICPPPPRERRYSTAPGVPARRRILGDPPCENCRFWREEILWLWTPGPTNG